ncbi:LuxR C-terminal-related transcriptional regulator [Arthrobacter sedimenti]|uniref:LuxR C-terminal-related transcriptional regulator n=1 Tax=Arthrobacter sedimenti TaxID=2694931 RepID=UPI000B357D17|nr:LuxR C-terminal-related transcriptional regulator [Arthrobacter sedimenti]OUM45337.1 hypothetical protein B8W73_01130 [Arthrobacter agilis]
MTVVDGRWPFAGRDADVASIRAVLAEESGRGVVLVGPSGIGKTMIAQHVVGGLSRHFDHIYLRGSAAHATTPYGALNVLLAELDEDTARSPLLVLGALQRMFEGNSAKRRTLMHIDGVEEIDELSATVIAYLARVGAVRLLVTCEDLLRAPGEFFDLWKDGVLERFDIQPLTLDDATELLTTALGAPISRSAAQELWASSGGNPKYLQMATKTSVASGHLFPCDGVWVSRDAPRPDSGRSVADWSAAELAALPAEDRAVVEVLAVAGRVPLTVLLKAVSSTSLDALQGDGVVTLDQEGVPLVRLTYEVFAHVVRAQLLSSGGRAALATVSALRGNPAMPVQGRIALSVWALGRGGSFDTAELVVLARLANDHRIDGAAERFLDALPETETGGRVLIERTRQLCMDGRVADALGTVEELLWQKPSEDVPLEDWVDARLLAARLRARTHGREQDAEGLLDDVVVRLQREPASEATAGLMGKAEVLRMELHVFEGELDRVCERARTVLASSTGNAHWSIRIRSLQSVARATMGAQEQAVAGARNIDARLANAPTGPFDREMASVHLCEVLLIAGYWSESLDRAGNHGATTTAHLFGGSLSEFAEGVLLAYLGRSGAALEKLVPAISQLRIRDRHGFLPLAEAAAAYAQVLEDAPDAAEDHLRSIDLTGQRYSWHLRQAVQYFQLLTEAWLDPSAVVAAEFLERALDLGSRGYRGVELFFLSQAVQLGQHEAADLLAASAAASEGPFARLGEDFAKGLASRDPAALKEAARRALDSGNHNLAGDIAALSIEHLAETDDPMIRVHAEQILRKTSTPARRHVRRKLLSERERAIARMVAQGVPNKEIAQQEHISPRTVEGHVHQVMSKLGLSSRKQLSLIFGQQQ